MRSWCSAILFRAIFLVALNMTPVSLMANELEPTLCHERSQGLALNTKKVTENSIGISADEHKGSCQVQQRSCRRTSCLGGTLICCDDGERLGVCNGHWLCE